MEIVNNTPFEVEALPFKTAEGTHVLTVIIKGTFSTKPKEKAEIAEEQMPIFYGDEFHDNENGGSVKFEADTVPFKPRADIAVVGKAYAPGGRAVRTLDVALQIGKIRKVIRVFGDRKWQCMCKYLPIAMTKPEPFTEMDLVYERAFGGMDLNGGGYCKENLIGRGFIGKKSKKSIHNVTLPNLEDPRYLITSWKDKPKPAGFGFYGKAWMPRAGYIGTYDEKWRKERSPEPPKDFRPDYYNAAHPDLQVKGYLKGDEDVTLVHLSSKGKMHFRLPGSTPKVTVVMTDKFKAASTGNWRNEEKLEEDGLTMHQDTLCLIPDEEQFYVVWRGLREITDLTALEIKKVEINLS